MITAKSIHYPNDHYLFRDSGEEIVITLISKMIFTSSFPLFEDEIRFFEKKLNAIYKPEIKKYHE